MSEATSALRLSLSPTLISSTATVSFSLTTGSTPKRSSASSVLRALRYRARPRGQRQARHAGGDGAGADEHGLTALTRARDLRGEGGDAIRIRPRSGLGDQRGADLDDEPTDAA